MLGAVVVLLCPFLLLPPPPPPPPPLPLPLSRPRPRPFSLSLLLVSSWWSPLPLRSEIRNHRNVWWVLQVNCNPLQNYNFIYDGWQLPKQLCKHLSQCRRRILISYSVVQRTHSEGEKRSLCGTNIDTTIINHLKILKHYFWRLHNIPQGYEKWKRTMVSMTDGHCWSIVESI